MVRTCIQVTAVLFTGISAYFLIKSVIEMKPKDIAELSRSYWDYSSASARNFTKQRADTLVGSVFLMSSLFLSLVNLVWPMRICDFYVDIYGLYLAGGISFMFYVVAYIASYFLQQHYYKQVEKILKKPKTGKNNK